MSEPAAPALDVVARYLRSLAAPGAGPAASRAVQRQRSWALREAVLFAAARSRLDVTAGQPVPEAERPGLQAAAARVRLADLFTDDFAEQWLAFADPVLRGVPDAVPATQRARMTSLRALAAFAGTDVPAHRLGKPMLRTLLTRPQVDAALRALTLRLPGRGPDDQVRLAAILSVMSVWPVRSVDLSGLRLAQVRERGDEVTVAVAVAAAGPGAGPVDGATRDAGAAPPLVLSGVAADRMREWIAVRSGLVSALSGGAVHALWVSIRSNSRPGGPRGSLPLPAGMPLRPRGLQRAYARSVAAANALHDGVPGFPLPRSLDLLRRSLLDGAPRAIRG